MKGRRYNMKHEYLVPDAGGEHDGDTWGQGRSDLTRTDGDRSCEYRVARTGHHQSSLHAWMSLTFPHNPKTRTHGVVLSAPRLMPRVPLSVLWGGERERERVRKLLGNGRLIWESFLYISLALASVVTLDYH